ncbi:MAG: hypothetical protein K6T86_13145 [Pirellulales bacterium]|nr:hypothetical protein [Pirellulales bacterium]
MLLMPVLDLKGGLVVHARRGERQHYLPVQSRLCPSSRPADLAAAFHRLGFREAYVADLDSIAGLPPARDAYQHIAAAGLELWIDAGLTTAEQAMQLDGLRPAGRACTLVAGLESLRSPGELARMVQVFGPERLVFSLDLRAGRPVAGPAWPETPMATARLAARLGVRRILVLDLLGVGAEGGVPTLELVSALHQALPGVELASGGGVRDMEDLRRLRAAGCRRALVATALHVGSLGPAELEQWAAECGGR